MIILRCTPKVTLKLISSGGVAVRQMSRNPGAQLPPLSALKHFTCVLARIAEELRNHIFVVGAKWCGVTGAESGGFISEPRPVVLASLLGRCTAGCRPWLRRAGWC
jgi:hypothetical protein